MLDENQGGNQEKNEPITVKKQQKKCFENLRSYSQVLPKDAQKT